MYDVTESLQWLVQALHLIRVEYLMASDGDPSAPTVHTSTISHSSPPEEGGAVLPIRPSTVTGSPVAHVDGYEHDKYSDQQRQHLPSPSVDTCRKRVGCVRRIWQGASELGTQFKRQLPGYVSRGAWRVGGLNYLCRSRGKLQDQP